MRLSDDFISQLKMNNPIDSVMSSYVQLKRTSRDYVCLCPFHSEKTPSCHVYMSDQHFHCFGCRAGGDVISFIMKAENLEYLDAVRFLAQRAGMTMPEDSGDKGYSRLRTRILEINRTAARYYNNVLANESAGEKGRLYFQSRQLSRNTITKYGLGYAPDGWQNLTDYLRSEGCTDDELIAANLAKRNKNGGLFDFFRDRVIFPIIDVRGNVVAFGGRILDGEGPKYLNSSDTPVFKKSNNLFSLNFAKRSDERRLILAEGYMDVIAVNQAGFENVVATLGTALTAEQARIMSKYADEVIIAYDSDDAGQNAAKRAINLLGEVGVSTKILRIEGAKDPDEYIKTFGSQRFRQLLDNSEGAVNFRLDGCKRDIDISTDTGRVEYLKRCVNVLADINSPVERSVYISKIAKETEISREALEEQIRAVISKRVNSQKKQAWNEVRTFSDKRRADPDSVRAPKEYKAEQGIIAYLCAHPDDLGHVTENLLPEHFVTDFHRRVYESMTEGMKNSADFNILSLQSEFSADEMGKITAILALLQELPVSRAAAEDYIKVLRENAEEKPPDIPVSELSDDDFLEMMRKKASKMRK